MLACSLNTLGGSDFQATYNEYIITGNSSVTVPVNLTNDLIREEMEFFFGNLDFRNEDSFRNLTLSPNQAEAFIDDDNGNYYFVRILFNFLNPKFKLTLKEKLMLISKILCLTSS